MASATSSIKQTHFSSTHITSEVVHQTAISVTEVDILIRKKIEEINEEQATYVRSKESEFEVPLALNPFSALEDGEDVVETSFQDNKEAETSAPVSDKAALFLEQIPATFGNDSTHARNFLWELVIFLRNNPDIASESFMQKLKPHCEKAVEAFHSRLTICHKTTVDATAVYSIFYLGFSDRLYLHKVMKPGSKLIEMCFKQILTLSKFEISSRRLEALLDIFLAYKLHEKAGLNLAYLTEMSKIYAQLKEEEQDRFSFKLFTAFPQISPPLHGLERNQAMKLYDELGLIVTYQPPHIS